MSLPTGASTDDDLWRDAIAGSADAWGALFLRHNRAIYNFCFRRTGQWAVAEDLTSTVFLEAWRRRSDTRPDTASALPWLYGIATMLTRNHHRTLRRYAKALRRIPPPEPEPDPADDSAARIDAERKVALIRGEQALGEPPGEQHDPTVPRDQLAGRGRPPPIQDNPNTGRANLGKLLFAANSKLPRFTRRGLRQGRNQNLGGRAGGRAGAEQTRWCPPGRGRPGRRSTESVMSVSPRFSCAVRQRRVPPYHSR